MKNKLIYFDNAATSFPKPDCVIRKSVKCLKEYCGNPGRSAHRLSLEASEAVYSVREKLALFLGVKNTENIVFTPGATFSLNLAMKSGIKKGSHILISDMEHNSVLRVAAELRASSHAEYDIFNSDNLRESAESLIRPNTTHIISTLASNVSGDTVDLKELSDIAEEYGLKLILDASQLLGHEKLSLEGIKYDALCSAGHKALFGMQGVGIAVFNRDIPGDGILSGGSGNDSKNLYMPAILPERFEAGTLPLPAIVSLGAGIDFINSCGIESISKKLSSLTEKLKDGIASLHGIKMCRGKTGIVSFCAEDIPSEELAGAFDGYGICVRGGFHCAPLMHKKIGTYKNGTVRASLSYFNTEKEIFRFLETLEYILRKK